MESKTRVAQWLGIDNPERLEAATIQLNEDSMHCLGISRAAEYTASWELKVGAGWLTQELHVEVTGFGWSRRLELRRSEDGTWFCRAEHEGEVDLPAPGIADPSILNGALDCDLGLCPVTNTMPIRHLELLTKQTEETVFTMAWVGMPSLEVIPSKQIYSSVANPDGGQNTVHYQSITRDFASNLSVDDDGLVIDYPTLARRI